MKRIILSLSLLLLFISANAGGPENAGHIAVSSNPLAFIIRARPLALDIRTGPLVHEFRYCAFGPQKTSSLYSALSYHNTESQELSMQFASGREYGYMMKILLGSEGKYILDDDRKFFGFYFGLGYTQSEWKHSTRDFTAGDKQGINPVTFSDNPVFKTKVYELAPGMILFPKRGFFMDAKMIMGIRTTRITFHAKDASTGNVYSFENNFFYDPKFDAEDFQPGHAGLYVMGHLRFGYSF